MPSSAKRPSVELIDLTSNSDDAHRDKRSRPSIADEYSSTSARNFDSFRESWAEALEEVDSSQNFDDDALQAFQHYGTINAKIVGIRFYHGRATTGEFVVVRREPRNQYDSNAIRIDNVMYNQIDNHSIILEGELTGPKGYFDMPVALKIFGDLKQQLHDARLPVNEIVRAAREQQKREKEAHKQREQQRKQALKKAASSVVGVGGKGQQVEQDENSIFANNAPPSYDPSPSSDPSMDSILSTTVQFNPREVGDVVNKFGTTEETLASLPKAKQPADLLTKMLPFQLQGLAWMLDRENPQLPPAGTSDTTQLWKANTDGTYTNVGTQFTTRNPQLASGGILADDMGLGKTIQILSLIVSDPKRGETPTLIVSPLSVMSNWSHQAQTHVRSENGLKVLIYHGANRKSQKPQDLQQYDIVITTYQTMALEYMPAGTNSKPQPVPRKTGLFSTEFRRVVLDEGHNIRSPKAKMTQAAYALLAKSRWILSGTPIVNNLRDLHSHVKFLRLTGGLEQSDVFTGTLIRPLGQQIPEAQMLLQALMSTVCLRRMKDMSFVDLKLPDISQQRYSIPMAAKERETYDAFEKEAKGILQNFQSRRNQQGRNTYASLLEVLLRMRQACNHISLCGDERRANILELAQQNEKLNLNPENLKTLRDLLQLSIDSHEECVVCFDPLHNPTITACAHSFGFECIERVVETQGKCPMCRAQLSKDDLIQPLTESEEPPFDINTSSSKIQALLNILKATRKSKPGVKTVVFSQWTSFLDIVSHQLDANGFGYCKLDGRMNAAARDAAMSELDENPQCTVMLASLGVCGVGLNLVAASQVIMSDSWWAPAIEDQAVDRVHRLGQTKDVTVFRLVIENSIEDRVLEIQKRKRELTAAAFGEREGKRKEKGAQMSDIIRLLNA
ncbi:MAG: hypothetical protein Q9159_001204 [Coniocarpon cinnabarinum]